MSTEEELEALKETLHHHKEISEQMIATAKRRAQALEDQGYETQGLEKQAELAHAKTDLAKLELEYARQLDPVNKEAVKDAQEKVDALQQQTNALDEAKKKIEEGNAAAKDLAGSLAAAFSQEHAVNFMGTMDQVFTMMQGGAGSVATFMSDALSGVGTSMIDNMIGLSIAAEDAKNEMMRLTGASQEFADGMVDSYTDTRKFGASLADASESSISLWKGMNDFYFMNAEEKNTLSTTGEALKALGVAQEDYTKSVVVSTKMMGMNAEAAAQNAIDMRTYARDIGVAPEVLIQQFAEMGPQLAKLGNQGSRAFKELARVSKITQMEMGKVLELTNKFDTFEQAAEMTGKLNAALGGNFVNAMDMMMDTDPASRFMAIRDSILDTGLTFDSMSYYQRQFYTESLGLKDVGELALMLSGNMDAIGASAGKTQEEYEDLAAQAAVLQSMQDQLNAIIAESTPIFEPFIEALNWLLDTAREYPNATKYLIWFAMGFTVLTKFLIPLVGSLAGMFSKLGFSLGKTAASGPPAAVGIKSAGGAAKMSTGSLLGFGAAMLLVGGAIAIAAAGIAELIKSFEGLTEGQASKAIEGLMVFGAMMVVMGGLVLIGGALAGKGMIIFGAGLLLVSLGLLAVAYGMTLIIDALGRLFTTMFGTEGIAGSIAGLLAFNVALNMMMFTLPIVLPAMVGFAAGLAVVAVAARVAEAPLTVILGLLNTLAETGLTELAAAFTEISEAINSIEAEKAITFTATMAAAQAMSTAATIAENNPITALGKRIAGTGGGGGGGTPEKMEVTLHIDGPALKKLIRGEAAKLDGEIKRRDLSNQGMGALE